MRVLLMLCLALAPLPLHAAPPERVPSWLRPGDEQSGADDDETEGADTIEVEVSTGTRTDHAAARAPIATEVTTREELVGSGAENLGEALEETSASIQTSQGFNGTSLRLRGLDAEHVLILIDGQRVTGRIGGAIDLRRLTLQNVERIEVVQGAGSVLHGGDALGGVVNVITRRPEPGVQAEARVSYGSRATLDTSGRIAGGGRRWGLVASGGFHQTAGWDADPSTPATTGDALRSFDASASGRFVLAPALELWVAGDYLQRDARGLDQTASGALLDRRNLSEASNAGTRLAWRSDDTRLSLSAHHGYFRDQYRRDQRGDDALDEYQPTDDHLVQLGVQLDQVAGKHLVTSGIDVQLEWLATPRVVTPDGGAVTRQRLAFFVQDEWQPSALPYISVVPALRVDFDTHFGTYPTGRLALLVAPLESLALRVAYGRGYRAPSFRDMYLAFANPAVGYRVAGNPELRPEQAWTLDLGATWTPREHVMLAVSLFDNRLRDLITTDLVQDADVEGLEVFGYVNVGHAYTRGVEAKLALEFLDYFALSGSTMLLDARDTVSDRRLPGRATIQGSASLEFHQPRWGTRAFARLGAQGRRPFTSGDAQQAFAPPYATLDLRISQGLLRYLTVFVGVENLLDAGDASLTPIAPRSFYGGITFAY